MKTLSRHLKDYLTLRRQLGFKFYVEGSCSAVSCALPENKAQDSSTPSWRFGGQRCPTISHKSNAPGGWVLCVDLRNTWRCSNRARKFPRKKLFAPRSSGRNRISTLTNKFCNSSRRRGRLTLTQDQRADIGTLLGLLAVTGMRVGEALPLTARMLIFAGTLLTIRRAKGNKSRLVPLHPSTVQALQRYAARETSSTRSRRSKAFSFGKEEGRLRYQLAWEWFRVAACQAGLRQLGGGRGGPRIHDLRHYFAVRTLLNWYRSDADVEARLPELATFLGHVHVSDTYWYVSAVPELLELATRRWERAEKGRK